MMQGFLSWQPKLQALDLQLLYITLQIFWVAFLISICLHLLSLGFVPFWLCFSQLLADM